MRYNSAPPGWIGQRVQVQWTDLHVRLLAPSTGQLLREHVQAPRGWHRIEDADRPARTPRPTLALLDRLLHHAHVLKCGPRSWRTKIHTDLRTEDATK